jgi:hypothetical protein
MPATLTEAQEAMEQAFPADDRQPLTTAVGKTQD